MADDEHLEYPRWEHHETFQSELVDTVEARRALLARWEAGEGTPKSSTRAIPIVPAPKRHADIAPPAPQFKVYDIDADAEIPLTQEKLDELLLAEACMSILWPAIRKDDEMRDPTTDDPDYPFPPETSVAIGKVTAKLAENIEPETVPATADEAPKRKPGRPRKNPAPEPTT